MAEYTQDELGKVIKDQQEKVQAKIYALRLKHVQRERTEAEIIELNLEIDKANDFIKLMQGISEGMEDKEICKGLKEQRRRKREGRTKNKSK